MKKKTMVRVFCLFTLLLITVSCRTVNKQEIMTKKEVKETENVETKQNAQITVENPSETKAPESGIKGTIKAVGTNSQVRYAYYRIRGTSSEGDFFDWKECKSPTFVLANITQGHWVLDIQAMDENGNVLIEGQMVTELAENINDPQYKFEMYKGFGNAEVTYTWNENKVINPDIDIYIKEKSNEKYTQISPNDIEVNKDNAKWSATNLPSGKYFLKAILKDSGYIVGGAGSTLKIFPAFTSTGNIEIITNDYKFTLNMDDIIRNTFEDVTGELKVKEGNIVVCSGEFAPNKVAYSWFVDGTEVPCESYILNVEDIGMREGNHRIDCIVQFEETLFSNYNTLAYFDGEILYEITSQSNRTGQI